MKKSNGFPVLIYRDEIFEDETRAGIESTHSALENLLAVWSGLDVGPVPDLWQLCTRCQKVYSDAFRAGIEVPERVGKYAISKDVFLTLVEEPTPNELYLAAKTVTKSAAFGYQTIWRLEDGKIVQDEAEVERIVNSRNIIAHNEHQAELGRAVIEYIRLGQYIDKRFTEIPWAYLVAVPWSRYDQHHSHLPLLTLEPDQLRVIIEKL